MNLMKSVFAFVFLLFFLGPVRSQGYEIDIAVNNLKDTTVILGHYLNKSMNPDDTIVLNNKGRGVFKGSEKLPQGLYVIFLPNTKYFDIIIGDDQQFSVETDTAAQMSSRIFKGSEENQVFLDFQQYMSEISEKANQLTARLKTEQDEKEKEKQMQELRSISNERTSTIKNIVSDHPDLFVSTFLKATLEVELPDKPKDADGKDTDSNWQYYYYRNHYFDNFDLSDVRLLRTPLYEDMLVKYLSKVLPQIPDTLIPETDKIIEKTHSDSTLYRWVLVTLFSHFGKSNIMGMDAVQMHIAEKHYIPGSWWSDSSYIAELKSFVEKGKPLLIGKTAPDIELMSVPSNHFIEAANDTALKRFPHVGTRIKLHQLQAQFTVLVFWESDCGHCKTIIPEMYKIYQSSLSQYDVKVLAISTLFGEEGKEKWTDFVNKNKMYDWINAWNPYSYEYKLTYDIITTPQIYLLDKDKKIIAKKISPEQVRDIIESLLKT